MGPVLKRQLKKWGLALVILFAVLEISGLKYRLFEKDYSSQFDYPMFGDITRQVDDILLSLSGSESGDKVNVMNAPYKNVQEDRKFTALMDPEKCSVSDSENTPQRIRVVYVVKSAPDHFDRRDAIRKTWGYEKRFSDVPIRTVFLIGQTDSRNIQDRLNDEHVKNGGDLVQGDFYDSYYNNTLKTLMGLKWAAKVCTDARFYAFVDDDYYVSTRNLLRFLRNPVNYPRYLQDPTIDFDDVLNQNKAFNQRQGRQLKQMIEFDLPEDALLYAGFVHPSSRPQRHWFGKWSVSMDQYPYHKYPPYVTAGAYVLSSEALKKFYYGTMFVKPYIFDDVYLGIVAKKLDIEPFHCPQFWFHRPHPYKVKDFMYTVASHEFSDPSELEKVWHQQKQAGNA